MSKAKASDHGVWQSVVRTVDGWLVPSAFGVFTVLVVVQIVTAVPAVRAAVDTASGRFVLAPVSATVPYAARAASISLYLSPTNARPDVYALINGQYAGNFLTGVLKLTVHPGDRLTLVCAPNLGTVQVSVDDNDPYLVYPLPGMSYTLTQKRTRIDLPRIQFDL